MASLELQSTFLNIRGKLNKRERMIFRQKKYRAETGAVLGIGSQESYVIVNPRDYKKNPPQGTELRNIKVFAEASRLTTLILKSGTLTEEELALMTDEQRAEQETYRAQLADFKVRFKAQLKKPDPQAPALTKKDPQYNPNSSMTQYRQYRTLNTFIRAMILQTLKSQQS